MFFLFPIKQARCPSTVPFTESSSRWASCLPPRTTTALSLGPCPLLRLFPSATGGTAPSTALPKVSDVKTTAPAKRHHPGPNSRERFFEIKDDLLGEAFLTNRARAAHSLKPLRKFFLLKSWSWGQDNCTNFLFQGKMSVYCGPRLTGVPSYAPWHLAL